MASLISLRNLLAAAVYALRTFLAERIAGPTAAPAAVPERHQLQEVHDLLHSLRAVVERVEALAAQHQPWPHATGHEHGQQQPRQRPAEAGGDRREGGRISADGMAVLRAGGQVCPVRLLNLSEGGLLCEAMPGLPRLIGAEVEVDLHDGFRSETIRAVVSRVHEEAQGRPRLALRFNGMTPTAAQHLRRYIAALDGTQPEGTRLDPVA